MSYTHTQRVPDKVMVAGGLAALAIGLTPPGLLLRLALLGTLGTAAATIRSLTVSVDETSVNLRFGDGFIRKSIPMADIQSSRAIRTTLWHGWGIHWLGDGWIYNIYGLDAVELRLKNGKRVIIGSDDTENLCQAIEANLKL